MRQKVALLLGAIVLALLVWRCLGVHGPAIQSDIQSRSTTALAEAELVEVQVTTHGRDIALSGTVLSEEARNRAQSVVRALPGVRRVDNGVAVQAADSSRFEIRTREGGMVLRGAVPDEQTRRSLLREARTRFGADAVVDEMLVDDRADPSRTASLGDLFEMMRDGVRNGDVTLELNKITMTGVVASEAMRESMARRVAALYPDLVLDNQLVVSSAATDVNALRAIEDILRLQPIVFATDSDVLTPESRRTLNEVAAVLARWPDVRVEISGYTDDRGDRSYNLDLSRRRAASVLTYLARTLPKDRFQSAGHGAQRPVADNATAEGRAANRRIEFRILKEERR